MRVLLSDLVQTGVRLKPKNECYSVWMSILYFIFQNVIPVFYFILVIRCERNKEVYFMAGLC